MSHQITKHDALFSTRMPTWHGLEDVVFSEYPTREQAQPLVHGWEPVDEPLYRRVPGVDAEGPYSDFQEIDTQRLVVRSDTGAELGVVSDTLELVTNDEMWQVAEAIQGSGVDVKYETGGSLAGGKKVWLLLTLDEPISVKGDPSLAVPYYCLQNSHDGTGAFRGQATMVRVVCANTAQMADLDATARGTEFAFSHTRNVAQRIEEAKEALAGWRDSLEVWRTVSAAMIDTRVTVDQIKEFREAFIPTPPPGTTSERVQRNVHEAQKTWTDILLGPTCVEINRTAWGLVAASIEYGEHYRRARSEESRFRRAYLNRNRITSDAMALAQEVARA